MHLTTSTLSTPAVRRKPLPRISPTSFAADLSPSPQILGFTVSPRRPLRRAMADVLPIVGLSRALRMCRDVGLSPLAIPRWMPPLALEQLHQLPDAESLLP